MKTLLKLEELAMLIVCLAFFIVSHASWWWYLILLIAPDITILGYLVGNKVGAFCFNFIHHKGISIFIYAIGYWLQNEYLLLSGIALFGHSCLERMLGYGLKTEEGFKFTHLGKIGNEKNENI
ncbi:MAG TPA: DUF4260 domain-containing protein [Chitinophagales bacterium]